MKSRPIERNMFYGAKKNIFLKAIELRRNMTFSEKMLWNELKNRNLFKVRFKRQHPIDIFIVDFYCHEYKLAIEIDGDIHLNSSVQDYDSERTFDIEKFGIKILRFTNNQVINDIEYVKQKILIEVEKKSPPLGGLGGGQIGMKMMLISEKPLFRVVGGLTNGDENDVDQ